MSMEVAFILYALVFRLAIIAVGFSLIYFGYRLFAKQGELLKTSIEASIPAAKIRITNTTSGTAFAVIGCVLLAVMIAKGEPELERRTTADTAKTTAEAGTQLVLRGQSTPSGDTLEGFLANGLAAEKEGDRPRAAAQYRSALALISAPLNNLAYIDCSMNDLRSAKQLIDLAVTMSPENEVYRKTAEEIKSGSCRSAKP
jgi:hypothetical protein